MIIASKKHTKTLESGTVSWRSPSNIAIVKYWGKHGEQLPANPSLSLTLTRAHTNTEVAYTPGRGKIEFYFEGKQNEAFAPRIKVYIGRLARDNKFLFDLDYEIRSENSFPHSAGIASSASAMSALALCIDSIVYAKEDKAIDSEFWKLASYDARLGSGSASRSIRGPVMIWGQLDEVEGSSDLYAVKAPDIDPVFNTYRDTILIVDQEEKRVKSSMGHGLMHNNPYAKQRFERARKQMRDLLSAMKAGDVHKFGKLAEAEALDLHGMMMTSTPPFVLMKPNTLSVINALNEFRNDTGLPVYMTLDAGPNVHLLYPDEIKAIVDDWINAELKQYCFEGKLIQDHVGPGAERTDQ